MSSLRNIRKTQKVHQERHQPEARKHLGALEKKKDYKIRAKDQNAKKKALKVLEKQAMQKNPDEFVHHMIRSEIRNGEHFEKVEDEELTVNDVVKDLTYITHRRSVEKKKIDKLKAQLHMLETEDNQPKNTHILFVDDEKEAKKANPAKLLDTHPALLGRTFNRMRLSQLSSFAKAMDSNSTDMKTILRAKSKAYKELSQRIERENKLRIMQDKLEVRKKLMVSKAKNEEKPKLVTEGTDTIAPLYKWPEIRKK